MATWNSRGLRGSSLEELINISNEIYQKNNLALIQKIPTPIKPVKMDMTTRQITLAYFDQKSTVDYIGVVQGIPVCFDAKECNAESFPIANIHEHQVNFMENFERQGGIAFLIIYFIKHNEVYYITYKDMKKFWDRSKNGGRKSFKYDEVNKEYKINHGRGIIIHYIEQLKKDVDSRES